VKPFTVLAARGRVEKVRAATLNIVSSGQLLKLESHIFTIMMMKRLSSRIKSTTLLLLLLLVGVALMNGILLSLGDLHFPLRALNHSFNTSHRHPSLHSIRPHSAAAAITAVL
jgi:hypothetical protein